MQNVGEGGSSRMESCYEVTPCKFSVQVLCMKRPVCCDWHTTGQQSSEIFLCQLLLQELSLNPLDCCHWFTDIAADLRY